MIFQIHSFLKTSNAVTYHNIVHSLKILIQLAAFLSNTTLVLNLSNLQIHNDNPSNTLNSQFLDFRTSNGPVLQTSSATYS